MPSIITTGNDPYSQPARWLKWGCCGCLFATATFALIIASCDFSTIRTILDSFSQDGTADAYSNAVHERLRQVSLFSGLVCIALAVFTGLIPVRLIAQLLNRIRFRERSQTSLRALRVLVHDIKSPLIWLTLIGGLLRWFHLFQPIRFDEAFSYLWYARYPWFVGITRYDDPNNHVFHTLLMHISTQLFGNGEWVIRLPAFFAGCAAIPATLLAGRATAGRLTGIAAAMLVAASSVMIEYSVLGRGYSLTCTLTMINLICSARILKRQTDWAWVLLIISSTVGMWTIPIMAYANILTWGWLGIRGFTTSRWHTHRREFLLSWMLAASTVCLGTLLLYSPVLALSGTAVFSTQGFSTDASSLEQIQMLSTGIAYGIQFLLRDFTFPSIIVLSVCFATGLLMKTAIRYRRTALLLPCLLCLLILLWQRVVPFPRVGLFLFPPGAIIAGAGLERMMKRFRAGNQQLAWTAWMAICFVLPIFTESQRQTILTSQETGVCPHAREVVDYLADDAWFAAANNPRPVITVSPCSAPVVYYAMRSGFPPEHFRMPNSDELPEAVIILDDRHAQSVEGVLSQLGLNDQGISDHFHIAKNFGTTKIYRFELPESPGNQE